MHLSKIQLLLSLLPVTLAQYGGGGGDSSSTTSAAPVSSSAASAPGVHVVKVGDGTLTFSPNTIIAAKGETVEFHFFPPAHSVAQSAFETPCTPLNGTGFFSGGITTASGENANVFTVAINDTNPIWFYCGFPGHCNAGMAGVINPPSDTSKSLSAYQSAAANAKLVTPTTVQGGTIGPAKAASSGTSSSGTSSASPSPSKSAGVETRGDVKWLGAALAGALAFGMGMLMVY